MPDFIVIPVLHIAFPITSTAGLAAWHIAWTSYCIPVLILGLVIVVGALIHEGKFHWYDLLLIGLPGMIWMLTILQSSHQLAMAGLSFYGGIFSIWVILPSAIGPRFPEQERKVVLAIYSVLSCFLPLACLALAEDGYLGPKLSIHHYFYGNFQLIW